MNKKLIVTAILVGGVVFFMNWALGAVPALVNYQGQLTDANGEPVADSNYLMTFSIYADSTGGTSIWSSGQQNVSVADGLFTYDLGSHTDLPDVLFKASAERYLGVKIGDNEEMVPRTRFTSVAYAYKALDADTADLAKSLIVPLELSYSGVEATAKATNADNGSGLYGESYSGSGVYGKQTFNDSYGYLGGAYGVYGLSNVSGNFGFIGAKTYTTKDTDDHLDGALGYGVYGKHGGSGNYGILGANAWGVAGSGNQYGVYGITSTGIGVGGYTIDGYGIYGHANSFGYAGFFAGKVDITGHLSKSSGSFKIDHPLDPENKYLSHSFVESPDMMNIYNGNVIVDANGEAVVILPDYFAALNMEFRYQLTAIGVSGPNLYIAEKIANNQFMIAGGEPGMEVSWQVTGIRHDPYAEMYRVPVEEDKPADEIGTYRHPEVYGKSGTMGIGDIKGD